MKTKRMKERLHKSHAVLWVKKVKLNEPHYLQVFLEGEEVVKLKLVNVGTKVRLSVVNNGKHKENGGKERKRGASVDFILSEIDQEQKSIMLEAILIDTTSPIVQKILNAGSNVQFKVRFKSNIRYVHHHCHKLLKEKRRTGKLRGKKMKDDLIADKGGVFSKELKTPFNFSVRKHDWSSPFCFDGRVFIHAHKNLNAGRKFYKTKS